MKATTAILAFALATICSHANAADFQYNCALKGGDSPVQIDVSQQFITIKDQIEGNGSGRKGDLVFENKGVKGGSGKMSDQLLFAWAKDKSSIYNWNFATQLYVQPALLSGGTTLRNGEIGGFISFVGEGFNYENYRCTQ